MKVLGIVCSPRVHGNTEILVSEALAAAREAGVEVELVTLAGKTISPCDACEACRKTGKCHIDDDMQPIYPKLLEADGIIFGSPVYFWNVSGQAKVFMDRTYSLLFPERRLRHKAGGTVVVATRRGSSSTYNLVKAFFGIHRIIDAGGAIAYARNREEVVQDEQGMREARGMGKAVARIVQQTTGKL